MGVLFPIDNTLSSNINALVFLLLMCTSPWDCHYSLEHLFTTQFALMMVGVSQTQFGIIWDIVFDKSGIVLVSFVAFFLRHLWNLVDVHGIFD